MEGVWFLWIVVFLIIWWNHTTERNEKAAMMIIEARRKNKNGEKSVMKELVKQFIGQDCLIYLMSSSTTEDGVIVSVSEDGGAIMVQKKDGLVAVNLDYVSRIRPYPLDKNGKRKTIWS